MRTGLINATIITGKKGEEPFIGSVVINDHKIERVVQGSIDDTIRKVDCTGLYLMPGLINAHSHLPGSGMPSKRPHDKALVDKLLGTTITRAITKALCKRYARQELLGGTTTVRCVGGLSHFDTEIRDSLKSKGPRLLVSDYALTVDKGHMAGTVSHVCNSIEDFDKGLKDLFDHHVDLIKIMVTGGVMDATKIGEPELRMTAEEIKYCTDKAHEKGLRVAAHVESTKGAILALENGVDTIEHGGLPTKEMMELFKEKNAKLVCTISCAYPATVLDTNVMRLNDMYKENTKIVFNGIVECAKEALKNGICTGLGNDAACTLVSHYDFYRELMYAHRFLGVSNLDAINMATEQNSKILGIENEVGTLEAGKSADILVLENDPTKNLKALAKIKKIIYKGKTVAGKVRKYPFVEEHLDMLEESN